jgi:hypothetical protein
MSGHTRFRAVFLRLLIATAVAIGFGAVVAPASPAMAVGCTGSGCVGKDPQSNGCSTGAVGVGTVHFFLPGSSSSSSDVSIQLRKSASCKARWARVVIDTGTWSTYEIQVDRQISTPYGWYDQNKQKRGLAALAEGTYWTPMVQDAASDRFRVCIGFGTAADDWCSPYYT